MNLGLREEVEARGGKGGGDGPAETAAAASLGQHGGGRWAEKDPR